MNGRLTAALLSAIALLGFSICGYSRESSASKQAGTRYVVRRGDSLIKIAKRFKTTPAVLISENALKNNKIRIGQKLTVPGIAVIEKKKKAPATPVVSKEQLTPPPIPESEGEEQPLRIQLVEAGFKMLGVRYRFSGESKKSGFDCSGLVKNLFSRFNINLPRTSREQFMQGEKVDRGHLEIGDLVFFSSGGKTPTHVGVYVGNDKFLHAARRARQVVIGDLNKIWYAMRYLGARRVPGLWDDSSAPDSQTDKAETE